MPAPVWRYQVDLDTLCFRMLSRGGASFPDSQKLCSSVFPMEAASWLSGSRGLECCSLHMQPLLGRSGSECSPRVVMVSAGTTDSY